MTPFLRSFLRYAVLLLAAVTAPKLHAQLDVTLQTERVNYVAYESIIVNVAVTNNTGNDVVLGGPNNTSWLNFLVTDGNGRPVTGIADPNADAIVCRNGQTLQRKFNLPRHFHMIDNGTYLVKASVYFPDLQRWLNSKPSRVVINQASRPQVTHTYALPKGHKLAGSYRKYQLFLFNDLDRDYLYLRIIDESTGVYLYTVRLNSIVTERPIQAAVDANQNLHILCLGSPKAWAYQVIDVDGKLVTQKTFRQGAGEPQLVTQPSKTVMVLGGTVYDPTEKPATPPGGGAVIRRLSARPAGVSLR